MFPLSRAAVVFAVVIQLACTNATQSRCSMILEETLGEARNLSLLLDGTVNQLTLVRDGFAPNPRTTVANATSDAATAYLRSTDLRRLVEIAQSLCK